MMQKRKIKKQDKYAALAWFASWLDSIDEKKEYMAELKEHHKRRSLNANAYAWVLIGRLADELHLTKEEVYRRTVAEMGGNAVVVELTNRSAVRAIELWESNGVGWHAKLIHKGKFKSQYFFCYGSSQFDKSQMSIFIDILQQDCKALGLETLTPNEVNDMLSLWRQEE